MMTTVQSEAISAHGRRSAGIDPGIEKNYGKKAPDLPFEILQQILYKLPPLELKKQLLCNPLLAAFVAPSFLAKAIGHVDIRGTHIPLNKPTSHGDLLADYFHRLTVIDGTRSYIANQAREQLKSDQVSQPFFSPSGQFLCNRDAENVFLLNVTAKPATRAYVLSRDNWQGLLSQDRFLSADDKYIMVSSGDRGTAVALAADPHKLIGHFKSPAMGRFARKKNSFLCLNTHGLGLFNLQEQILKAYWPFSGRKVRRPRGLFLGNGLQRIAVTDARNHINIFSLSGHKLKFQSCIKPALDYLHHVYLSPDSTIVACTGISGGTPQQAAMMGWNLARGNQLLFHFTERTHHYSFDGNVGLIFCRDKPVVKIQFKTGLEEVFFIHRNLDPLYPAALKEGAKFLKATGDLRYLVRFGSGMSFSLGTIVDLKKSAASHLSAIKLDALVGVYLSCKTQLSMSPSEMQLAIHSEDILGIVDFCGDIPRFSILCAAQGAHRVLQETLDGKNSHKVLGTPDRYRSAVSLSPEGPPVWSPDGNFLMTSHQHQVVRLWQITAVDLRQ